ncbi:MAG TPA: hypothetical protein VGP73_05950 [Thermoanaerobaculia bacterium]
MPAVPSPASVRRLRAWLIAYLAVAVLAVGAHLRPVLRARSLPTAAAQWIWKPVDHLDHNPTAFYAARDFDLASPPARARLMITADEEYVVTLNGKRIGAGAFERGAPLDVYEVGPLLLPGGNRLLVELRSSDGTGGLLASLVDEATGRQIVGTGGEWRILPSHQLGLPRGWTPIGGGEPAFVWGYPPVGRWGRPRVGAPRPLLDQEMVPPLPAASMLPLSLPAGLSEGRPPGSPLLYDWGRTVEGILTLEVPPSKDLGMALLFTGETPPDPLAARPTASVLVMPGAPEWLDARPRRFRYALLVGLKRPAAATVRPGPREQARPPRQIEDKVFGIQGPPLRTPVEDEVWSKLQRFPRTGRGEDL